jgi:hypothetical protein
MCINSICSQKSIFLYLYFALVMTSFISCSSDDVLPLDDNEEGYHILVIGNSLSRDALSYVPFLINEISPYVYVDLKILYKSGTSLNGHWELINKNSYDYTLDYCNSKTSRWYVASAKSASSIISMRDWDLVILQQGSSNAYNYSDTQPYIHKIVDYVRKKRGNAKIAYMLVPSRASGIKVLKGKTSDEIWKMQADVAYQLLNEGEVDYVIPCGTAIQNARHTTLDVLGDYGHLTYDGLHLQEGIPCLVDVYTATQSLFNILSIDASIYNSSLYITQQWVYEKNILGQHGYVISGTEDDYVLCKQCALMAVENPYEISLNP